MGYTKESVTQIERISTDAFAQVSVENQEITVESSRSTLVSLLQSLKTDPETRFEQLIDLCGVDYQRYGQEAGRIWQGDRFAIVYHLLSVSRNQRLRVVVRVPEDDQKVDSVVGIWKSADWYEREVFDLFGILFDGHPDLRRLLTDYGFIGHPFRKDFPVSGHVQMRYDEAKNRVVYEPVSVEPRVTVPRVIPKGAEFDRDS
ncbi:MAG: NADH-quinone oxidoreductase subunit C [Pseudomonadota bacterium]|nr:NADH-quinone oxidoreductase subunit C [Pseudomonadota bacterium]